MDAREDSENRAVCEKFELGPIPATLQELREYLNRRVETHCEEGSVTKILVDGAEVFKHVAGNCAEDAIFRIYSMTKAITCAAFLQICGEGKLQFDTPLADILPCFHATCAKGHEDVPITLRHLMTHTSGLDYGPALKMPTRKPRSDVDTQYRALVQKATDKELPTLKEFVEALAEIPLISQPGTKHRYSYSIDVLGRVLEVVEEKPLDRILKERITDPLGMKDTSFSVSPDKMQRLVPLVDITLNLTENNADHKVLDCAPSSRWVDGNASRIFSGGGGVELVDGGLVSTADDFMLFCEALRTNKLNIPDELYHHGMWDNHLPLATHGALKTAKKGAGWNSVGLLHTERIPEGMVTWGGMAGTKFGFAKNFCWVFMSNALRRDPKWNDEAKMALFKIDFVFSHALQGHLGQQLPPLPSLSKGKGKGKGKRRNDKGKGNGSETNERGVQ